MNAGTFAAACCATQMLLSTNTSAQGVDEAWIKSVTAMTPEEQVRAVVIKLRVLNPNFDCAEQHKVEGGAVTEFSISSVGVTDLSPIKALQWLRKLVVAPPKLDQKGALTDLAPLAGMQLTWLWCHNNPIADLTPLRGMPLSVLGISGTRVADLTPLAGMKLQVLSLNDTVVGDLTPLAGMPLATLWCHNARVTDHGPLRGLPLRELKCDFVAARDAAVLREIKTLARINDMAAQAFWVRVGPATSGSTPLATSTPPILPTGRSTAPTASVLLPTPGQAQPGKPFANGSTSWNRKPVVWRRV